MSACFAGVLTYFPVKRNLALFRCFSCLLSRIIMLCTNVVVLNNCNSINKKKTRVIYKERPDRYGHKFSARVPRNGNVDDCGRHCTRICMLNTSLEMGHY